MFKSVHTYDGGKNSKRGSVVVFASQAEMAMKFCSAGVRKYGRNTDRAWHGGDVEETCLNVSRGNSRYGGIIRAMKTKIAAPPIDVRRKAKKRGVFGPVVNVQQYYAGNPACFTRKDKVADERGVLKVVFDIAVSGGIATETIERRGAAVLNAVEQIGDVRPVELWIVCGLQNSGKTMLVGCPVEIAPVDYNRAGWLLCSPAVLRQIMFSLCKAESGNSGEGVQWAYGDHDWQNKHMCEVMAGYCGYKDSETLYMPSRYLDSGDFSNDMEAQAWVKRTVEGYTGHKAVKA